MAATMKDVALRAGVSIRTVSRAINGLDDISAETRQKILLVAKDLGYRPSMLARALVTRRSRTLGLALPHLTNPYFAEVAQGVYDSARENGYTVLMNHLSYKTDPEIKSWLALSDHAVEGIITDIYYGHEPALVQFAQSFKPIVVLFKEITLPGICTVKADLNRAVKQTLKYLINKGHRKIALLVVPIENNQSMERFRAYQQVMAEYGLPEIIQFLHRDWQEPDIPSGYKAALHLFTEHPDVTAVFAYNDLLALGVLGACKASGRKCPEDCAVIGCDDIPDAAIVTPTLTTVRMNKYELGRQALLRLLEMLENPQKVFEPKVLDADLVIRESA